MRAKSAAAVVLLRPGNGDEPWEVFLARRDPALAFLGGFHAFPGGTVEAIDSTTPVSGGARAPAFVSAACRELFEETGVLVARGAEKTSERQRAALRERLLADPRLWPRLLADHGLELDSELLTFIGHWVTPPYNPVIYYADYFVAGLPESQAPAILPGELVDGAWVTVRDALTRHHRGDLFISYPVLETLRLLDRHRGDIAAASREATQRGDAARPGGELIVGVHVVPLETATLPPATTTNTWVLGRDPLVVVDPGSPHPGERDKLLEFLERLGGAVREIWLSHHHHDHTAGVEHLRDALGVPVAAHALTAERLDLGVDREIEDGEVTVLDLGDGVSAEWQALHTPGHAPGHLCFFEQTRRLLLSGDNVVTLSTVIIEPPDGDMRAYLETLVRMRDLGARFLFPSHGPPTGRPREAIQEYIDHRVARERAILAALSEPLAPEEIVPRVYTDVEPGVYALAAVNVRAHLDKLVGEGRVAGRDGRYVLASNDDPCRRAGG